MKVRKRAIAAWLLLLCAIPTFLGLTAWVLPAQYGKTYYAELGDMLNRLETTQGKKIVVIGGSNVAFGLDVPLLESEFPEYTVCSFGLYGSLGTKAMMELAEPQIHAGDIVILAPELTEQSMSLYFSGETFLKCVEKQYQYITALDADDRDLVLGAFWTHLQNRWTYFRTQSAPNPQDVYAKSSFDEACNMIYLRTKNTMQGGYAKDSPVTISENLVNTDFVDYVNAFYQRISRKGAVLWYDFSPVNQEAVTTDSDINGFFHALNQSLQCLIIGSPQAYLLDSGWFYDTNFHLNTAGAQLRTRMLAQDIHVAMGEAPVTNIAMPELPQEDASPENAVTSGRDENFLYEVQDGAAVIVGLTEGGAAATRLVIPTTYEGLPVAEFAADVFAGNTVIEEIIIPDSVRLLYDGSFAGCENLKSILLLQTIPDKIGVGSGLLTDTSADLYVPQESYAYYTDTSYAWTQYADRTQTITEEETK